MKKIIWLLLVLLMICVLGFAVAEEEEEYNPFDDLDMYSANKETLYEFFSGWAMENIYEMPKDLIYDQRTGGETTTSLMKMLMESGTPLSYQINSVEGELGDDVMTYICTIEIESEDGKDPHYEQAEVSLKAENGYYWIDILSVMNREPGEYDPEAETISLAENDILKKKLSYFYRLGARPIGLSCESNGIRVEVVSGGVEENKMSFLVSVEDLNGQYNGYTVEPRYIKCDMGYDPSWGDVLYDMKRHKGYSTYHVSIDETDKTDDRMLTLKIKTMDILKDINVDLTPYIKEYAKTMEGIPAPENVFPMLLNGEIIERKGVMVLDCSKPLDVPLTEGVWLKGAGWINDQLHIQIADEDFNYTWVHERLNQKQYTPSKRTPDMPAMWEEKHNNVRYYEYIYDYKPEDLEILRLYTATTTECQRVDGPWEIQFPLSMICPEVEYGEEDE